MSTPEQLDALHKDLNRLCSERGTRLVEVLPLVFPDYQLVQENARLRDQLQAMFWERYSHLNLLKLVRKIGQNRFECRCMFCYSLFLEAPAPQIANYSCKIWKRMKECMQELGITYFMPPKRKFGEPYSPPEILKDPEGFNRFTACKYLYAVSHLDFHLVFSQHGNAFAFLYGRKIWDCSDAMASEENDKLKFLFIALGQ